MITKYAGLAAAAVVLAACWTKRQVDVVSGGEVVATRADIASATAIPAGASLAVRIDQAVGTERSKVGDNITATVSTSLLARNGDVIVPQGARVYGQITGLDDSDDPTDRALIQLRFEGIEFLGDRYPLRATVIDVGDVVQRTRTGQVVERAAMGAAAGAVIGAIISGGELDAILKGGGFGATAGTIISLGLGDVEHVIPAGTAMVLRADNTVDVRGR